LIEIEAIVITLLGATIGVLAVTAALVVGQDWMSRNYGLFIEVIPVSPVIGSYLGIILVAAVCLALIPAITAYRRALVSRIQN
jgi:putative ABC transport system permease protein